jgi:hypothetical protein
MSVSPQQYAHGLHTEAKSSKQQCLIIICHILQDGFWTLERVKKLAWIYALRVFLKCHSYSNFNFDNNDSCLDCTNFIYVLCPAENSEGIHYSDLFLTTGRLPIRWPTEDTYSTMQTKMGGQFRFIRGNRRQNLTGSGWSRDQNLTSIANALPKSQHSIRIRVNVTTLINTKV